MGARIAGMLTVISKSISRSKYLFENLYHHNNEKSSKARGCNSTHIEQAACQSQISLPCTSTQFCRGRGQMGGHISHGTPCHTPHTPSHRSAAGTSAHPLEGEGVQEQGMEEGGTDTPGLLDMHLVIAKNTGKLSFIDPKLWL